jgi:segregation and condensation protein B
MTDASTDDHAGAADPNGDPMSVRNGTLGDDGANGLDDAAMAGQSAAEPATTTGGPADAATAVPTGGDPADASIGPRSDCEPAATTGDLNDATIAAADGEAPVAATDRAAGVAMAAQDEIPRAASGTVSSDPPTEVLTGSDAATPEASAPAGVPLEAAPGLAAAPLRDPDEAALRLAEAVVFASVTPTSARALSQILPDDMDAASVIAALRLRYEGRGIELVEIGGGLQFRTAADLAPRLRKVVQVPRRLPRVALETLAIVAYHQPVTRPEIEDMRGASLSQQTLDVLLENDLIVARGRKETPGRPTLWGTTPKFLEYFGLRDIRELPRRQDLLLETVRPEAKPDGGGEGATDGTAETAADHGADPTPE